MFIQKELPVRKSVEVIIRSLFIGVLFIVLVASNLKAQPTPIICNITVSQPVPADLSRWSSNPNQLIIVLVNTSQKSYQVRFAGFAEKLGGGTTITIKKNYAGRPILIGPNASLPLNLNDFPINDAGSVDVTGGDKNTIIRTKMLPEGTYRICVQVVDYNNPNIQLSNQDCKTFNIAYVDPPQTINPACSSIVSPVNPQLVQFQWTPIALSGSSPQYEFSLIDLKGNQQPEAAFKSFMGNPFFQTTQSTSIFTYGPSEPALIPGNSYAWRVRAIDPQKSTSIRNDGYSSACSFTYGSANRNNGNKNPKDSLKDSIITKKDSTSKDSTLTKKDTASGACKGDCTASLPSDKTPSGGSFKSGDILTLGKFHLTLKTASGGGSGLSGDGSVEIPYLKSIKLAVKFSGLKVNSKNEVYDGNALGVVDPSVSIADEVADNLDKGTSLTKDDLLKAHKASLSQTIDNFTGIPFKLPFGIDKDLGGGEHVTLGIIGAVFTPTKASINAVSSIDLPFLGAGEKLALGAKDVCISPDGLGGDGTAKVYLAADLGFSNVGSFEFHFKGGPDTGTFIRWDCKGFQEFNIVAEAIFPRDWLVPIDPIKDEPIDDISKKVIARFVGNFKKAGNWMLTGSMPNFAPAAAPDFVFKVSKLVLDESDIENPAGIKFPNGYGGDKGLTWNGFYMDSAVIRLPKALKTFKDGKPPSISVKSLIIDKMGFSASIRALHILQLGDGDFGSWGASLDTIGLDFVASSMTQAFLSGKILMPITDSGLDYRATLLNVKDAGLQYAFTITPHTDINIPLWIATATIEKTSVIGLKGGAKTDFEAYADISGKITLGKLDDEKKGSSLKVDLAGIKFEHLEFSTKTGITCKSWSFASPDHSVSGFPISISNLKLVAGCDATPGAGISFDFDLALTGETSSFSASTNLTVCGKIGTRSTGGSMFEFGGFQLNQVKVSGDIGAVSIKGQIDIYKSDATYGDGFKGAITATIAKLLTAHVTAQFGAVNGYRYWYIDGGVLLDAGIPIGSTGVGIYGFLGGVWYHMDKKLPTFDLHAGTSGKDPMAVPADASDQPGKSNSGVTYTPNSSIAFGIAAGLSFGTFPSPVLFNADVLISAQFTSGGGLGMLGIQGSGWLICKSIMDRDNALMFLTVNLSYDFVNQIFDANIGFNTNKSFKSIFYASGWMNFHIDQTNWHLLIGTPDKRIKLELLTLAQVDAYLMAGTDIPAPDFNSFEHKSDIEEAIGSPLPTVHMPISGGTTEGFAMGASMSINTGKQRFLIFFAQFSLGYGFDVALTHDPTKLCDNTGKPPGINGWYAMGQLYAYVSGAIGLHVDVLFYDDDFTILDIGAGARCIVMAPNPIWVEGTVGGHYNILNGLIKGNCSFSFELGDKCVVSSESPFSMNFVSDMNPTGTDQSVFAAPQAGFNVSVDEPHEYSYTDGNGNTRIRTFRLIVDDYFVERKDNNARIAGDWKVSSDLNSIGFLSTETFPEYTWLRSRVKVHGEELISGSWSPALKRNKSAITQDTSCEFKTGPRPDYVDKSNVIYTIPLDGQRYLLQSEHINGFVKEWKSQSYLFDMPGTYVARFTPVNGNGGGIGPPLETSATPSGRYIYYHLPSLTNEQNYIFQIVRKEPGSIFAATSFSIAALQNNAASKTVSSIGSAAAQSRTNTTSSTVSMTTNKLKSTAVSKNEKELFSLYFRTSKYNTVADKVSQLSWLSTDYYKYWGDHEAVTANYHSNEGWDIYDMQPATLTKSFWTDYRPQYIIPRAPSVREAWYKNWVYPNIYDHYWTMVWNGIWDGPRTDKFAFFFGWPTFYNYSSEQQSVQYVSKPDSKLSISSAPSPSSSSKFSSMKSFKSSIMFGSIQYTLKLAYKHTEWIPDDYFAVWFKSKMVMLDYSNGATNDEDSYLYGKDDWINNNASWLNYFNGLYLGNFSDTYHLIDHNYYNINFVQGEKFQEMIPIGSPWVQKQFFVGSAGEKSNIDKSAMKIMKFKK